MGRELEEGRGRERVFLVMEALTARSSALKTDQQRKKNERSRKRRKTQENSP